MPSRYLATNWNTCNLLSSFNLLVTVNVMQLSDPLKGPQSDVSMYLHDVSADVMPITDLELHVECLIVRCLVVQVANCSSILSDHALY